MKGWSVEILLALLMIVSLGTRSFVQAGEGESGPIPKDVWERWEAARAAAGRIRAYRLELTPGWDDDELAAPEPMSLEQQVERSLTPEEYRTFLREGVAPFAPQPNRLRPLVEQGLAALRKLRPQKPAPVDEGDIVAGGDEDPLFREAELLSRDVNFVASELTIVQLGQVVWNDERYLGNRSLRRSTPAYAVHYDVSQGTASFTDTDAFLGEIVRAEEVLFVPPPELPDPSTELTVAKSVDGRELRISARHRTEKHHMEGTIDVATGIVTHLVAYDDERQPTREIWQTVPVDARAGERIVPAISAQGEYARDPQGRPRLVDGTIFVILETDFSAEISDKDLRVPLPKGTVLVDERESAGRQESLELSRDLPDITLDNLR